MWLHLLASPSKEMSVLCWRTVGEDSEPWRKEELRMASPAVMLATVCSWLLNINV